MSSLSIDRTNHWPIFALIICALATFKIQIEGLVNINLSLFEPMLAALVLRAFLRSGILVFKKTVFFAVLAASLLVLHAFWTEPSATEFYSYWLKGYLKNLFIIFDLCGLHIVLKDLIKNDKTIEGKQGLTRFLLPFYLVIGLISITLFHDEITARTIFVANMVFLHFLNLLYRNYASRSEKYLMLALMVFASLYVLSKVGVIVVFFLIIADVLTSSHPTIKRYRIPAILTFFLSLILIVSLLHHLEIQGRSLDSVTRSFDVRMALWTAALQATADTFPKGIGAGLWRPYLQVVSPVMFDENHHYVHSTILSYTTELGLLGILILGGIGFLFARALLGLQRVGCAVALLACTLPFLLLHDIQGMRMFLIALMLGLAIDIRPSALQRSQ
ncbi:hypothetical protein [Aestuariispira insulae]|uniref:O-antigen ligase n=1 Tax=Aestuariispira insulae TaxID=1461337 RepID=A0A3D9H530_9PROT|nr:hypothetical protein [Aestuariispira insulae]RED44281.1 hypothetical protein DFP90_11534 [Aestuariispira insulae]